MSKKQKKQRKKKTFEVNEHESIEECLERIRKEGYTPVRKIEKPIFREDENGINPVDRTIIFEAVTSESEH